MKIKKIQLIIKQAQTWIKQLNPSRSLKNTLSYWFILFAAIPLFIIVSYSAFLINQRMNSELTNRLVAFEEGIDLELTDIEEKLRAGGQEHSRDSYLINLVYQKNQHLLENATHKIMENFITDRISFFTATGDLLLTVSQNRITQNPEALLPEEYEKLPKTLFSELKQNGQLLLKETHQTIGYVFDAYTLIKRRNRLVGILKETVVLGPSYFISTKERTGLDLALLDINKQLLVSTLHPDQESSFQFPSKHFKKSATLTFPSESFRMLTKPIYDEQEKLAGYLSILVSRTNAKNTLKEIRNIFILICAAIALIVFLFSRIASRTVLQPIELLLKATEKKGKMSKAIPETQMEEIKKLIKSFNEMQAQLVHSSRMVSLGQLVAGVAHELNNPIGYTHSNISHLKEYVSKIKEMIQLYKTLTSKLPKSKQDQLKKQLEALDAEYILTDIDQVIASSLDGTQRTKDIVTGLRNFSRMDEADLKTVDIHEGINNTLRLLSSEFKNKLKVHKNYGKIDKFSCYPSQLNQVFMNLLSNAAHAIEKKGDIWIQTRKTKDYIEISFRDNGKGISKKNLERIFEPFFTTKKIGKGTGLGLSISFGIIQKHQGQLLVESNLGEGSTFTIQLPKNGLKKAS